MKRKNYIYAGLGSISYYFTCVSSSGKKISLLWIWYVFGCICLLGGILCKTKLFLKINRIITLSISMFATLFLIVECFVLLGMNPYKKRNLDYIIVLGARVVGKSPSLALKYRIDTAYHYLIKNPTTIAILSGGKGANEDISEAECIARELRKKGITKERIRIEKESTSTIENMKYSSLLIQKKQSSIGIVTNNFHVFRSVYLMKSLGWQNVYGISAPYTRPLLLHYMVREFFAFLSDGVRKTAGSYYGGVN